MRKSFYGVVVAASVAMTGCSDKESAAPAAQPAQPAAQPAPSVGTPAAQPAPVAPPPVAAAPAALPPGAPAAAAPAASSGPSTYANVDKDYMHHLVNLNSAYQSFRSIEMRSPKDLNELVTSKRIDQLPPAPTGKAYKIDEPNLRIILVNQ